MAQKANGLAHAKWVCKRHVVSCPKYRRRAIHDQCREDLGQVPRQLCQWKGVEIIEGRLMPGHVRMLVPIPPKISVSSLVGCLRGKSSLLMFDRHADPEHEFGNGRFWAEGHCVSTVGPSEATAAKYIREQEQADIALDRPGAREWGSVQEMAWRSPFDGHATSQAAIGPERSARAVSKAPCKKTHRLGGDTPPVGPSFDLKGRGSPFYMARARAGHNLGKPALAPRYEPGLFPPTS